MFIWSLGRNINMSAYFMLSVQLKLIQVIWYTVDKDCLISQNKFIKFIIKWSLQKCSSKSNNKSRKHLTLLEIGFQFWILRQDNIFCWNESLRERQTPKAYSELSLSLSLSLSQKWWSFFENWKLLPANC